MLQFEDTKEFAKDLIGKFSVNVQFSNVLSIYRKEDQEELYTSLRYYAIKHICEGTPINLTDFWKTKEISDQKQSEDSKKSVTQMINFLLPICLFRLTCIQENKNEDFFKICDETLSKIERSSWSFYSYDKHKLLEIALLIFTESICVGQKLTQKEIKDLLEKALRIGNTSPQFKLELLEKLACNTRAFQAALAVLGEIDVAYEKYPASAKEMSEVYLGCAQIGN